MTEQTPRSEDDAPDSSDRLHRRALDALRAGRTDLLEQVLADGDLDVAALVEHLRVYQAELEIESEKLRTSERQAQAAYDRYRALFTNLPMAALVVDDYGLVVEANSEARSLLTLRNIRSHQYFVVRLVHPDDRTAVASAFERAKQTESAGLSALRLEAADGNRFQADLHIARLPGGNDMPQQFICALVDRTEVIRQRDALARAYDALERSEERYRLLADFSPDWDYWMAPDRRFVYVSPACLGMTGYSAEAFRNDASLFERILHPDDLPRWQRHMDAVHESSHHDWEKLHFRIRTQDGHTCWIEHTCRPITAPDGRFLGRRGVNRTITHKKSQKGSEPF
jgi:PAS domain S-box-containing protein